MYVSSKIRHKVSWEPIKQSDLFSYFATSDVILFLNPKGVVSLIHYEYSLISFIGQWSVHFLLASAPIAIRQTSLVYLESLPKLCYRTKKTYTALKWLTIYRHSFYWWCPIRQDFLYVLLQFRPILSFVHSLMPNLSEAPTALRIYLHVTPNRTLLRAGSALGFGIDSAPRTWRVKKSRLDKPQTSLYCDINGSLNNMTFIY